MTVNGTTGDSGGSIVAEINHWQLTDGRPIHRTSHRPELSNALRFH
jgi:hypothetical protein